MNLQKNPRVAVLLCAAGVVVCAAAPAGFLAVTDAAYFDRTETVAEPYSAPVPSAEDYYILRQLNARSQGTTERSRADADASAARPGTFSAPKMYVSASSEIESMTYAPTNVRQTAEDTLTSLAACGVVPESWVQQALAVGSDYSVYQGYSGNYYDLHAAYYATDSLGFVTVRRFAARDEEASALYTMYSVTMDSRTGTPVEVWLSIPADAQENADEEQPGTVLPDAQELTAFAELAGLDSLGDWTAAEETSTTRSIYSANGQARITASTHPYRYGYTYTPDAPADGWYYSLTLQTDSKP